MTQQRQRRRPMSREEARALEERKQRRREREQESRELARGPIDLPFCVLVVLLSGIVLTYLSFFLGDDGEVADSVLYYMAQCFVYAGSIFGVTVYLRRSLRDIREKLGVKE